MSPLTRRLCLRLLLWLALAARRGWNFGDNVWRS